MLVHFIGWYQCEIEVALAHVIRGRYVRRNASRCGFVAIDYGYD